MLLLENFLWKLYSLSKSKSLFNLSMFDSIDDAGFTQQPTTKTQIGIEIDFQNTITYSVFFVAEVAIFFYNMTLQNIYTIMMLH